ncbi:MAG: TonB-dependent siderophore receptor, partial [Pseudomonadota bacterium]
MKCRKYALARAGAALGIAAAIQTFPLDLDELGYAFAQQDQRQYSIPGGSLAEALNTFGVQSGIGVGYDIGTVRGLTTPGLSGTFSDQEAL